MVSAVLNAKPDPVLIYFWSDLQEHNFGESVIWISKFPYKERLLFATWIVGYFAP